MAKLTITDAAHACHVARTTIQRAVKAGRLSLDADHMVDTAELLRVGYQLDAAALHAATQQDAARMQQNAAPPRSTPQHQTAAPYEAQLIRQERDALAAGARLADAAGGDAAQHAADDAAAADAGAADAA
jgi:hypothetical protein